MKTGPLRRTMAPLLAAALATGCAGAPPAGTPEHEAWIKQKQAEAAAIEENGRVGDSLRWFRPHALGNVPAAHDDRRKAGLAPGTCPTYFAAKQ